MNGHIFKDWNILKWIFNILILILTIYILGLFVNVIFAIGYVIMLVIHELGHVMAAKGYGANVRFGGFTPFGAYIQILDQTSIKENAVIAISGPLCGLITTILYFFSYYLLHDVTFLWLSFFTGVVSLMNLLPLDPFDGGKVVSGTFYYFPLIFLPVIGYGIYMTYTKEPILAVVLLMLGMYIIRNVMRMKKAYRLDSLFYLEKSSKAGVFFVYLLVIVLLAGMLCAMLLDFGLTLLPEIQPVTLPPFLNDLIYEIQKLF